jgi:hypothetical protein
MFSLRVSLPLTCERPSDLEPDDVVGVMGDGHLVGFFVSDPDTAFGRAHGGARF